MEDAMTHSENDETPKETKSCVFPYFPRRYLVAILSFFGLVNIYALRVNRVSLKHAPHAPTCLRAHAPYAPTRPKFHAPHAPTRPKFHAPTRPKFHAPHAPTRPKFHAPYVPTCPKFHDEVGDERCSLCSVSLMIKDHKIYYS